jgi:hypothetical protein
MVGSAPVGREPEGSDSGFLRRVHRSVDIE